MLITQTKGSLEYLTAPHIAASHAFTTRLGGVSTGKLSSLNLGMSRGDDPKRIGASAFTGGTCRTATLW